MKTLKKVSLLFIAALTLCFAATANAAIYMAEVDGGFIHDIRSRVVMGEVGADVAAGQPATKKLAIGDKIEVASIAGKTFTVIDANTLERLKAKNEKLIYYAIKGAGNLFAVGDVCEESDGSYKICGAFNNRTSGG